MLFNPICCHFKQSRLFTFCITISYKKMVIFTRNALRNRLISDSFCLTEIIIIVVNKFVRYTTNLTRKNCLNVNRYLVSSRLAFL